MWFEVPPGLTSRERSSRPGQGKTDPIASLAIARITAREPALPPVRPMTGRPADLRVLIEYRDDLVAERTALANRVHSELGWLRAGYHQQLPHLTNPMHLQAGVDLLAGDSSVRAEITRRRLQRMLEITVELKQLRSQIADLVEDSGTRLTAIYGVGPLVAARILGEVVDIRRYPTRHHFATANGSAPIPASSGRTVRHRLNRGGNRQLNRALYTIAITEIRADTEGRAYHLPKRAEGKTSREALRCLKRRLSDIIYKTLRTDLLTAARQTRADRSHHDSVPEADEHLGNRTVGAPRQRDTTYGLGRQRGRTSSPRSALRFSQCPHPPPGQRLRAARRPGHRQRSDHNSPPLQKPAAAVGKPLDIEAHRASVAVSS
jgi:transposase